MVPERQVSLVNTKIYISHEHRSKALECQAGLGLSYSSFEGPSDSNACL